MNETLKVLDPKGVEYLWSKISMQDYPNNETLISVINAIDETKADKSELIQNADSLTDIDKTQIRNNIGVSGYNWREIKYTFTAYNFSNIVIVADIDGKDINNWDQILTIYDQTGRAELGGVTDYPAMLSVLMMLDFVLDPVAIDDNYRLNLCQNVIIPNLESLIHANALSTDIWFAVNSGIGKIDHINIWTSDADTYNFIISESTYRPSTAYLSYKKSSNSFTYNTLKPDYGYTDASLSIVNAAADAKAVGDALDIKADQELVDEVVGVLADHEVIYNNLQSQISNKAAKADIPTKTSELENDSGFLDAAPVTSVNGQTGAVTLSASDVGALPNTTEIPDAYTHPASHPASMITGLATVATSGKYSDLSGKPTIPTVPSTLPNPNALTINEHTYDGSEAVTVDNRVFIVTVTGNSADGYTADKTYEEILAAHNADRSVVCLFMGEKFSNMYGRLFMATEWGIAFIGSYGPSSYFMALIAPDNSVTGYEAYSTITINGQMWDGDTSVDFTDVINGMITAKTDTLTASDVGALPDTTDALPNPNALTINGTTYDGSEAVNITIAGGSVSENISLGQTPITITKPTSVRLAGEGLHTYTIKGKTVVDMSNMTVTTKNATLTEHEDYIEIIAGSAATAWWGAYVTFSVKGLVVGKTYVFAYVGMGLDTANLINNGYYIIKNSNGTELAKSSQWDGAVVYSMEFTPDTSDITITCYPASNYYWKLNYRTARIGDIYINEAASGTERTDIIDESGEFIDSCTLGQLSAGVTISTEPSCDVYEVSGNDNDATLPLAGKTVVCFGDSLFGMYTGDTSAPAYVAERTGATVYNVGFGGCRMSVHPYTGYNEFGMWALAKAIASNDWSVQDAAVSSGSSNFPNQLAILKGIDFSEVDAIVIHYGTNDFTASVSIDNGDNYKDYNTLCGALRYSIEELLTAYPQLRIFVSVPAFRYWEADDGTVTYSNSYTNANGNKLTDFVDAIASTAKEYNLPVIDSYYGLGINKINAATFLADGVHHNAVGRKRFGEFIGSCMIASF